MRKAFEKISAENIVGLSQSNEVILMDVFSKLNKQGEYVPHLLILTEKFVLYYTVMLFPNLESHQNASQEAYARRVQLQIRDSQVSW